MNHKVDTEHVGASRTATSTPNRDLRMHAERVRTLYGNAPAAMPVNLFLSVTLVVITADTAGLSSAAWWCASVMLSTVAGLLLSVAYRRIKPAPSQAILWDRLFVLVTLLSGVAWGLGAIVLFTPGALVEQITIGATVVCLAAGIIASNLSSIHASYAFLFAAVVPYAIAFGLQNTSFHYAVAFLILVFVLGMTFLARGNCKVFAEVIELRFEAAAQRDEAEHANLAKSKFLAAASHDLRQPLHAMTLLADSLEGHVRDTVGRSTLSSLKDSLGAMRRLFNSLLDISRLDAGVVNPVPRDMPLGPLIDRLRADYAAQIGQTALEWRCPATTLWVHSDPVMLENMLRNLTSNAIRYTQRGYVAIDCRKVEGLVRIEVQDTGIGIAPDKQQEIFREFLQLDNPERDSEKGLGLGLAIVDGLARLLKHQIAVRSAPGEGSCFSIVLPLASSTNAALVEKVAEDVASMNDLVGMVVLVVDDHAASRDAMQKLLTGWGCNTLLADSEDSAIAAVRESSCVPDVIVSDYRLRDHRTGRQAIDRIRSEFGTDTPAVIVTGDTAPERLREAQASGDRLLHKPVPPARLRALLKTLRRAGHTA